MQNLKLKDNFYYVGVVDHDLKVFDIAMLTEFGTSYNSYLLKTSEGAVVFEGSKAQFTDEYVANIESLAPITQIKYLVVTHTEPDHSGSIEHLLALNPDITVIASYGALANLDKIIRKPFKKIQMTADHDIQIGGFTFHFVSGLLLHWPDVMFTYIKELKVLISCDAFGAHFASDAILLSHEKNKEGYQRALRFYFEKVMSPFSSYVLQACERVSKLDIDMICPGHGPVIDADVRKQIAAYRALAEETLPANDPNKVTIVFATAYGYTRDMADCLRKSFAEAGKKVDFYEISALNFANIFPEIRKSILTSGLILFGSPTIIGDAVGYFYEILNSIHWTEAQGKKASAFGDFGWSGEAVKNLSERLEELHFKVIPGFKWNFKMDADGHKELAEYYKRLSE